MDTQQEHPPTPPTSQAISALKRSKADLTPDSSPEGKPPVKRTKGDDMDGDGNGAEKDKQEDVENGVVADGVGKGVEGAGDLKKEGDKSDISMRYAFDP